MIDYSIIKNEETESVAVRSIVKSFGLDHVTDKDIVTFYSELSSYAQIDTGLLPIDGTGLLAYRQAADYSQIVIQHAPGVYRIMWGANEGDRNAKHYFLAQPYRIVIGDLYNGSLLGARMFYSPVPITSPSNELYHVNLPNINCRGYRGNGVGWVCLYHNEDWSGIPLSEKVARLMERCSGAEAYNDANMSETDGPRFYAYNGKPQHLIDPSLWESKTTEEGYAWTLEENVWLPILVKDRDQQGQHDPNGVPLTLGMALTGDYQAYYTDKVTTKPINALTRSDRSYSADKVFQLIKLAYAKAEATPEKAKDVDPYTTTVTVRSEYTKTSKSSNFDSDDSDDEDTFMCSCCNEYFETDSHEIYYDHAENPLCEVCLNEYYTWINEHEAFFSTDDCVFLDHDDKYVLASDTHLYTSCSNCDAVFHNNDYNPKVVTRTDENGIEQDSCIMCSQDEDVQSCAKCKDFVYVPAGVFIQYRYFNIPFEPTSDLSIDPPLVAQTAYFHTYCASSYKVCPCGFLRDSTIYPQDVAEDHNLITVQSVFEPNDNASCCKSCVYYNSDTNDLQWMSNTGTHSDYIHSPEGSAVLKDMHQWNSIQVLINNIQNSSNNNNIEKKEVSDEPF
jgi:hypothetical protein